ncbi:MAG: SBBP repeat-containing protein, partial [Ignavibacteria bacterium]|nr:SBBP repeat-containing protein [Ignavibacteria bacterium]
GIDWIWRYDERGQLHHEFELSEEANPEDIRLKVKYADYEITPDGKKLILSTPLGRLEDGYVIGHRSENMLFPVEVSYRYNRDGSIGYEVMNWDRSTKLIIDPPLSLTWATFYGGGDTEIGRAISNDLFGNIFISGFTASLNFPSYNPGGGSYFQGSLAGYNDIVLLKFSNTGIRLWSTYYGGGIDEIPYSSCNDSAGNFIVVGATTSPNFPVFNPGNSFFQNNIAGLEDGFILKFNNYGIRKWATFYGGSGTDRCFSVIASDSGKVNIGGYTNSIDFPVWNFGSGSYFQSNFAGGNYDMFILKFDSTCKRLGGTYYGGSGSDYVGNFCISPDFLGNLYFTGYTNSVNFPILEQPGSYFQSSLSGSYDVFIIKFNVFFQRLWATYYGGSSADYGNSIIVNNSGDIMITGYTTSVNFPCLNLSGAYFQPNHAGGLNDGFILKFNNSGVRLWSTYFGGSGNDIFQALCIDRNDKLYLTGFSLSQDLPLYNPGGGKFFQGSNQGEADAFLINLNNNCSLLWATYYGGSSGDYANSVCSDNAGNIFMTGYSNSGNLPVNNPGNGAYFQQSLQGTRDIFISKFGNYPVSVGEQDPILKYFLSQNLPNPFNPYTFINFSMASDAFVELKVFDITGKEICTMIKGSFLNAGYYNILFDGSNLPSGIYFYRLDVNISGKSYSDTKKMILLR